MTPKEKAKELLEKMYNTDYCGIKHFPNKRYCDCTEINYYQAKQCALIAVDEVIKALDNEDIYIQGETDLDYHIIHWKEVKQEIEKL
jgi:hypothetical protein